MARNRKYNVAFRRKREGKTDYKQRLGLLKSRTPRLVVRRTLANIVAQIVEYQPDGDKVLVSAKASDLKKSGLAVVNGNVPTAYLTGLLVAKKAAEKKIKTVIVDAGLQKLTDQSRLFAVVKGAIDGGLNISASDSHFPSEDRLSGKHIEDYANAIAEDKEAYEKQFKAYLAANIDPKSITKVFEEVKGKLN